MNKLRILIPFMILAAVPGMVRAQSGVEEKKEFSFNFRFNRSVIDSDYSNNCHVLQTLGEVFDDLKVYIDSLSIQAYSSPDGNPLYNQRLTEQRAKAVENYLIFKYPYLSRYDIRIFADVEKWEEVLAIVENLPDVPYKAGELPINNIRVTNKSYTNPSPDCPIRIRSGP